jgi:hypothetical protein
VPEGRPAGVKSLILQGFYPSAPVAKKPLSGYNMSYFLNAVSRTGKYRRDNQISASELATPSGFGVLKMSAASRGRALALSLKRGGAGFALGGRGKLYRKGLLDGNY